MVSGAGSVTKSGTATLTLAGENTYTGVTSVSGGSLVVTGSLASSAISLASGTGLTFGSAADTSYAGAISGDGSLTKAGSGILTVTGVNTSTGATNVSQGTLVVGATNALSSNSAVTVACGATLDLTSNNQRIAGLSGGGTVALGAATLTVNTATDTANTFDGTISGSGGLTKTGAGTLTLSGNNTYTGATVIVAGILTLGGSSASSSMAVSSGATLNFAPSTTVAYAGGITGSGHVTKTGNSRLTLSGDNSGFTGDLTLVAGTVSIGSANNLGASAASLIFDGGTLAASAAVTIEQPTKVNSGGGTLDNAGNAVTLSGSLSGSGNLTLSGSGTDTLSATFNGSTYTGTLRVNSATLYLVDGETLSGTLDVASGASLSGVGMVGNLNMSGTISPGNSSGTLTVSGNYVQTATGSYSCQVTPTSSDLIAVTGSASLSGAIAIQPEYTSYNSGTTWTVLTATGGVSGAYTTVTYGTTPDNWVFVPVYTGNSVVVTLTRQSYATSSQSAQASSTGSALDAVAYDATGQMATLIQYLDYSYGFDDTLAAWSVSKNALTDYVLNVLSAEPYDAFTQILFDAGRLLASVQRSGLYGDVSGSSEAYASPTDIGPASLAALSGPSGTPPGMDEPIRPLDGNGFGVFIKPLGMLSGQQGSCDRTGYNTVTGGITGGMLFRPSPAWTFALAPGFVTQAVTLHTEGGGTGMVQDWSLALLGGYHEGGWHADVAARAGYDAYQSKRNLPLPTYSGTANATWNGWNTSLSAGGGYDVTFGKYTVGPFGSVQWQHAYQDGFRESRVGTLGQSVRERSAQALTTIFGGRVSRAFELEGGAVVTPEIRAAWSAEWLANPGYVTASFIGSPGSSYHAVTADQRYHAMLLDAGATVRLKDSLSFSARIGVELFRPGHEAQAASVGLKYSF